MQSLVSQVVLKFMFIKFERLAPQKHTRTVFKSESCNGSGMFYGFKNCSNNIMEEFLMEHNIRQNGRISVSEKYCIHQPTQYLPLRQSSIHSQPSPPCFYLLFIEILTKSNFHPQLHLKTMLFLPKIQILTEERCVDIWLIGIFSTIFCVYKDLYKFSENITNTA